MWLAGRSPRRHPLFTVSVGDRSVELSRHWRACYHLLLSAAHNWVRRRGEVILAGQFHTRQQLQLPLEVKVSPCIVACPLPQFGTNRASTSRPADNGFEG